MPWPMAKRSMLALRAKSTELQSARTSALQQFTPVSCLRKVFRKRSSISKNIKGTYLFFPRLSRYSTSQTSFAGRALCEALSIDIKIFEGVPSEHCDRYVLDGSRRRKEKLVGDGSHKLDESPVEQYDPSAKKHFSSSQEYHASSEFSDDAK